MCVQSTNTPLIDVAKEIETYILGDVELPEYVCQEDAINKLMSAYIGTFKQQGNESNTAVSAEPATC